MLTVLWRKRLQHKGLRNRFRQPSEFQEPKPVGCQSKATQTFVGSDRRCGAMKPRPLALAHLMDQSFMNETTASWQKAPDLGASSCADQDRESLDESMVVQNRRCHRGHWGRGLTRPHVGPRPRAGPGLAVEGIGVGMSAR